MSTVLASRTNCKRVPSLTSGGATTVGPTTIVPSHGTASTPQFPVAR